VLDQWSIDVNKINTAHFSAIQCGTLYKIQLITTHSLICNQNSNLFYSITNVTLDKDLSNIAKPIKFSILAIKMANKKCHLLTEKIWECIYGSLIYWCGMSEVPLPVHHLVHVCKV